jgi:hypothetical protein
VLREISRSNNFNIITEPPPSRKNFFKKMTKVGQNFLNSQRVSLKVGQFLALSLKANPTKFLNRAHVPAVEVVQLLFGQSVDLNP